MARPKLQTRSVLAASSYVPRKWPPQRRRKDYHVHLIDLEAAYGVLVTLVYESDNLDDAKRACREYAIDNPHCVLRVWSFLEHRVMYLWR